MKEQSSQDYPTYRKEVGEFKKKSVLCKKNRDCFYAPWFLPGR